MRSAYRSSFFLVIVASLTVGCSIFAGDNGIFRDRQSDYTGAGEGKKLTIPQGIAARPMTEYMKVPDIKKSEQTAHLFSAGPPRAIKQLTGAKEEVYRLKNSADGVVLYAEQSLEDAWACAERYWDHLGINLSLADVTQASMDTGWLTFPSKKARLNDKKAENLAELLEGTSNDMQQRFRLIFKRGSSSRQTNITAMHTSRDAGDESKNVVNWEKIVSDDSHLEGRLLNQLMIQMAQCSFSTAPQVTNKPEPKKAPPAIKSRIKQIEVAEVSHQALEIKMSFPEAWEKFEDVLAQIDVQVSDKDRSSGLYFIEVVVTPEMLDTNTGQSKNESAESEPLKSGEKRTFRLRLRENDSKEGNKTVYIYLMDGSRPAPAGVSGVLLKKLKDTLKK